MKSKWEKLGEFLHPSADKALLFLISGSVLLYYYWTFRLGEVPVWQNELPLIIAAGIPFLLAGMTSQSSCLLLGYAGIKQHCISYLTVGIGFILCYLYVCIFAWFAKSHDEG